MVFPVWPKVPVVIIPGEHAVKCLFSLEAHVTMSRKHLLLFSIGCCDQRFSSWDWPAHRHTGTFFFFLHVFLDSLWYKSISTKPQLSSLSFLFSLCTALYTHTRTNTLAHSRMNFQDLDVQGEEKHVLKCQCSEPHHLAQIFSTNWRQRTVSTVSPEAVQCCCDRCLVSTPASPGCLGELTGCWFGVSVSTSKTPGQRGYKCSDGRAC